MAAVKVVDERHKTRGGGTIRIETWHDPGGRQLVGYAMTYINHRLTTQDNGRVLGFDNRHQYRGFATRHHIHWCGSVRENRRFVSCDFTTRRFDRILARLSRIYRQAY